jgi:alkylated DNA repair dioxygenase AlkB
MNARSPLKAPAAPFDQPDLFGPGDAAPAGFRYRQELITPAEELALAERLAGLTFEPFDFHGHLAHRQVVGFGLRYDYASRQVTAAAPIPDWLTPLRARAAAFAGRPAEAFVQVLINEYRPGAGIGWHRDKQQFDEVVAVSLLAPCPLRFRCKHGETWERRTIRVEPRSAYLLSGSSRHEWEHSIPPLAGHRYSITMRTLATH